MASLTRMGLCFTLHNVQKCIGHTNSFIVVYRIFVTIGAVYYSSMTMKIFQEVTNALVTRRYVPHCGERI